MPAPLMAVLLPVRSLPWMVVPSESLKIRIPLSRLVTVECSMRLPVLLKRKMPTPEGVAPSHDTFTSVNVLPPPPVTEIPVGEPERSMLRTVTPV